jgi:hypothetical protein
MFDSLSSCFISWSPRGYDNSRTYHPSTFFVVCKVSKSMGCHVKLSLPGGKHYLQWFKDKCPHCEKGIICKPTATGAKKKQRSRCCRYDIYTHAYACTYVDSILCIYIVMAGMIHRVAQVRGKRSQRQSDTSDKAVRRQWETYIMANAICMDIYICIYIYIHIVKSLYI